MIIVSLSILAAFFVSLLITKWQIKSFGHAGIDGTDMHKTHKPRVPEMGGLSAIMGFVIGLSILLSEHKGLNEPMFLTALIGIIGAGLIGMVDDMVKIRQRLKAFLPYLFTIPFGINMMGTSLEVFGFTINNPYLILLVVPFGVTCAANASNMLEGFNGLGAGLSIIISTSMIFMIYLQGGPDQGFYILFPLLGAVMGFGVFNLYPSLIFPGDTFTLFSGAAIGIAAIISGLIAPGIIMFIPMILEFFLKFKGGFKAENFAQPNKEGYLKSRNHKIESLTHLLVKHFKLKEWQLVSIIWGVEIVLCVFAIIFYVYL
ncbi:MAG: hypothetical protein ACOC53_03165 [Candidatus Saliniplasma sp.]